MFLPSIASQKVSPTDASVMQASHGPKTEVIWCNERCYKRGLEDMRAVVEAAAGFAGFALTCFKKAPTFVAWATRSPPPPYLLLVDNREFKPCSSFLEEAGSDVEQPLAIVVMVPDGKQRSKIAKYLQKHTRPAHLAPVVLVSDEHDLKDVFCRVACSESTSDTNAETDDDGDEDNRVAFCGTPSGGSLMGDGYGYDYECTAGPDSCIAMSWGASGPTTLSSTPSLDTLPLVPMVQSAMSAEMASSPASSTSGGSGSMTAFVPFAPLPAPRRLPLVVERQCQLAPGVTRMFASALPTQTIEEIQAMLEAVQPECYED